MRIGLIGAGISAIATAAVLTRAGHQCVLFEKAPVPGGIWALAYPDVRLQNSHEQYSFADFPWPETPDQHPTAAQIRAYLDAAIAHYELDVRLAHSVTRAEPQADGWRLSVSRGDTTSTETVDYLVCAIGQYAEGKHRPEFPGESEFGGPIVTERDVHDLGMFDGKRVAVLGFGKSAVDMAAFAAPRAAQVDHIFRTPRWLIPFSVLGVHFTYPFFARASTIMMPSWVHSGPIERALHRYGGSLVRAFWSMIAWYVRTHMRRHAGGDADALARIAAVTPTHDFAPDLRSATAMAPRRYFAQVAANDIRPHHAGLERFTSDGVVLSDGNRLTADLVVLSVGSGTPQFPFFPDDIRALLEHDDDGVQLYRHLVHPRIERLAFAGYNHGFMHVAAAEIGALWLASVLRGDIVLPSAEAQEQSVAVVQAWKRAHVQYEPSRSCAVSTRFQQYLDAMLRELGVNPLRKMPNAIAEFCGRYGGADYAGVVDLVLSREARRQPCLPFDT